MAFVNGSYNHGLSDISDLGCCGCQSAPVTTPAASGFDFASIPLWAWIAAGAAAFLMITKKGGR